MSAQKRMTNIHIVGECVYSTIRGWWDPTAVPFAHARIHKHWKDAYMHRSEQQQPSNFARALPFALISTWRLDARIAALLKWIDDWENWENFCVPVSCVHVKDRVVLEPHTDCTIMNVCDGYWWLACTHKRIRLPRAHIVHAQEWDYHR